ncbi:hypothetical protein RGQ29_024707 [Quercus rubra]|uniref:Uncharacterized protein n=1 Tax=Quercus rubra TaxID=3512 RepID=A0AAN7IP34_QUERU|nr:hypothetical protein RGQ29_024707 [Quercus rubra]
MANFARSFPEGHLSFNVTLIIATRNTFLLPHEQHMPNSLHAIFAFMIPVVIALLGQKYQGKAITPFDTHPMTMTFGISCFLAYCLAYGFELKSHVAQQPPTHAAILGRSVVVFGSLSLVSFVSILFPVSVQPILFGLYTLLLMGFLLHAQVSKLFGARERKERQTSHRSYWNVAATTFREGSILPL